MNKVYRNIWNGLTGTWVAAPETATRRARGGSTPAFLVALVLGATLGDSAFAATLSVKDGTTVTVEGTSYSATAAIPAGAPASAAILADGANSTIVGNNLTGLSSVDNAGVVLVQNGGLINLTGGTFTGTATNTAVALSAGRAGILRVDGVTIDTMGNQAAGATVGGGMMTITNSAIKTSGTGLLGSSSRGSASYGVSAVGTTAALNTESHATVTQTRIDTMGDNSSALYAVNGMIDASQVIATTTGTSAYGAHAAAMGLKNGVEHGGAIALNHSSLTTGGDDAHGLFADGAFTTGNSVTALSSTDDTVLTNGARAIGALAANKGAVSLNGTTIATRGVDASGAVARNDGVLSLSDSSIATTGANAHGVAASGTGTALLSGTSSIKTAGAGSHALYAQDGATITTRLAAGSVLDSSADSFRAESGSSITGTLDGTTVSNGGNLIHSIGNANGAGSTVTLNATGSTLSGAMTADTASAADLSLGNGSVWAGHADHAREVSLDDTSRWQLNADSSVATIANAGTIAFAPDATHKTLAVKNYMGNGGTIVLNTQLGGDDSPTDKLVIDGGAASGQTSLQLNSANSSGGQTQKGVQVVETINGGTTATGAFHLDPRSTGYRNGADTISVGGYDYRLMRGGNAANAEDWYLVSAVQPVTPAGESNAATDPGVNPTAGLPSLVSPESGAYLGNRRAASTMAVHTLNQRRDATSMSMGQADANSDVFVRIEGGQNSHNDPQGLDIDQTGRLAQAGGDVVRFSDGRGGSVHLGAMGSYGSATTWSKSPELGTARGTVEGYDVGAYGTWYGNSDERSGPYVDAWMSYGAFDNTVGGAGLATDQYRSTTFTSSLETGYSIPVLNFGTYRVFVQPQGQIVYSSFRAKDHETSGTVISGQNDNSVSTRLGVRMSGRSDQDTGNDVSPFAEVNWWHGPGSQTIAMGINTFRDQVPADRLEAILGVNGRIGKQLSVWGAIGTEAGASNYTVVSGQFGVRYVW